MATSLRVILVFSLVLLLFVAIGSSRDGRRPDGAASASDGQLTTGWAELILGCFDSLLRMRPPLMKIKPVAVEAEDGPELLGDDIKPLFIFGDSLFDVGNNIYVDTTSSGITNYPYGFTYFPNATGRVSDGRVVPDFIAEYANLPYLPPSLQPGANFSFGANFAWSGATVIDSNTSTSASFNFREQVSQFKDMAETLNVTLGTSQASKILGEAVYLFSIGGDDYFTYYEAFYEENRTLTLSEQEQKVKDVVSNITDVITEMYEIGARKIAFQNVGPMGCLPWDQKEFPTLNGSCAEELLSMPRLHNEALYRAFTDLAATLDGFKFSIFDYYTALFDRIQNPSKYGFAEGRKACYTSTLCEYPSAYIFFDQGHTTQCANEQLAKQIWNGDSPVTSPYNVRQLFEES